MIDNISKLTGISKDTIILHGVQFLLKYPEAAKLTPAQCSKLQALKSFINQFNEATFLNDKTALNSPEKAAAYFIKTSLNITDREYFRIAFLNSLLEVIAVEEVAKGTLQEIAIYPREIIKLAFKYNTAAICISHNHPSGNLEPSAADVHVTKELEKILKPLGIRIIDHIITNGNNNQHFSFRKEGKI